MFSRINKSAILSLFMLSLTTFAHATTEGAGSGGGGTICEDRFKIVANEIAIWLQNPKTELDKLNLENGLTPDQYRSRMFDEIAKAKPECVDEKIYVGDREKTCKGFIDENGTPRIKCNFHEFLDETSESDQYRLVHHEYAGLSGVEINVGEDSDYSVSDQITGYLTDEVVKKLAVKPSCGTGQDCGAPVIHNCSNLNLRKVEVGTQCLTSKQVKFQLVARTPEHHKEVWKDLNTGLIWSDRLDTFYTQYDADAACSNHDDSFEARGNLCNVQFHLPKIEDFETAEADGFREVLPNLEFTFWSSSLDTDNVDFAYDFFGNNDGSRDLDRRDGLDAVTCVGR